MFEFTYSKSKRVRLDLALNITCVRGITTSVSARRWEGGGFDVRPKLRHS